MSRELISEILPIVLISGVLYSYFSLLSDFCVALSEL